MLCYACIKNNLRFILVKKKAFISKIIIRQLDSINDGSFMIKF